MVGSICDSRISGLLGFWRLNLYLTVFRGWCLRWVCRQGMDLEGLSWVSCSGFWKCAGGGRHRVGDLRDLLGFV